MVLPLPLPPPNPRGCSLASYDVDANDDPRALVVVVVEDATNRSRRYWEDDGIPTKKTEKGGHDSKKNVDRFDIPTRVLLMKCL